MSNSPFVERLLSRRKVITDEIGRIPRGIDGRLPKSASKKLRAERDAIDRALARHSRERIDNAGG